MGNRKQIFALPHKIPQLIIRKEYMCMYIYINIFIFKMGILFVSI